MTQARVRSPKVQVVRKNTPLFFLTLVTLLAYGGFYDFITLGAGVTLTILLLYTYCHHRKVFIPSGAAFFLLCGATAAFVGAVFGAVSPVAAWTGVLRMAVWVLYYLYAASYTENEREDILTTLGYAGAAMALCSLAAFSCNLLAGVSDANGRIDGFFQYANTYALFLAVCLVLLLGKQTRGKLDFAAAAVLLLTILLTGSRGVILLLALPAAVGAWHLCKTRGGRMALLIGATGVALVCILAVVFSGGLLLERFLSLGRTSSSVNGRLLYNLDGLRILQAYPLGVGRGGYLYVQPLFQSGVYTLQFIHNDYLQAALDGGVLAGVLFTAAMGFIVFRRGRPIRQQLVVLMIALHCAIDFNLQFTAIPSRPAPASGLRQRLPLKHHRPKCDPKHRRPSPNKPPVKPDRPPSSI